MNIFSVSIAIALLYCIKQSHLLQFYASHNSSLDNEIQKVYFIGSKLDLSQDQIITFSFNCSASITSCNGTVWSGMLFNETIRYNLSIEASLSENQGRVFLPLDKLVGCKYFLRISSHLESELITIWIISQDPIFYRMASNFNKTYSVNISNISSLTYQYSLIPEVILSFANTKVNVFIYPFASKAYQIDTCELLNDSLCGTVNDVQQPGDSTMLIRTNRTIYILGREYISRIALEPDYILIRADKDIIVLRDERSTVSLYNVTSNFSFFANISYLLQIPDSLFHIQDAKMTKDNILLIQISIGNISKLLYLNLLGNETGNAVIWTFDDLVNKLYMNPFFFTTFAVSRSVLYTSNYLAIGFITHNISNITSIHFQRDSCIIYTKDSNLYFPNCFSMSNKYMYTLNADCVSYLDNWGQPFIIQNNTFSYISTNTHKCPISMIEFIPSYLPYSLTIDKWETVRIRLVTNKLSLEYQSLISEYYHSGPAFLKHSHSSHLNQTHKEIIVGFKPTGISLMKIIPKCLTSLPIHQRSLEIRVACPSQHKFTLLSSSEAIEYYQLSPNYRPPSSFGISVHTSTNIYNYYPEFEISPSLHHKSIPSEIKFCKNAKARIDCNCTREMTNSEELGYSECKETVRVHHYHHPLHIQPAIVWEGGQVLRELDSLLVPFTLIEVNNRTEYIYSEEGNYYSINFLAGGLFHFKAELTSETQWTYCSFKTQFQVFVVNVPLMREVEHAVTVITATLFCLGMGVGCVLLKDVRKSNFKPNKNSYFKKL